MRQLFPKMLLVALLFVGGCVSTPERSPELQQQIALANNAIEIGDYDRANEIIQDLGDGSGSSNEVQIELSLKLLRHAASSGSAKALIGLGNLYLNGIDVPQDSKTAFAFFETAANAGDTEAIYRLGLMYKVGQGVEKDHKRARELFLEASYQDVANAQFEYAQMLSSGEGGEQNLSDARDWLQKAAQNGHFPSKILSEMLDTAMVADARGWFRRKELLEMQYWIFVIEEFMPNSSSLPALKRVLESEDVTFTSKELFNIRLRVVNWKSKLEEWASKQK